MRSMDHDRNSERFEMALEGESAVVDYRIEGDQILFTHTFVPPEFRGQGIAEQLVKEALAFAKAEGKEVVPLCSYVVTYLQRHPIE